MVRPLLVSSPQTQPDAWRGRASDEVGRCRQAGRVRAAAAKRRPWEDAKSLPAKTLTLQPLDMSIVKPAGY